jgi:hypothetical protein
MLIETTGIRTALNLVFLHQDIFQTIAFAHCVSQKIPNKISRHRHHHHQGLVLLNCSSYKVQPKIGPSIVCMVYLFFSHLLVYSCHELEPVHISISQFTVCLSVYPSVSLPTYSSSQLSTLLSLVPKLAGILHGQSVVDGSNEREYLLMFLTFCKERLSHVCCRFRSSFQLWYW